MKILKFTKMMRHQGCRVILYGPDESDAECDEHVILTTQADRERWGFGAGFDTVVTPFLWDANQPYWFEMNTRAIDALKERIRPQQGEYLCLIAGWTQQPIAAAVAGPNYRNPITVEWGVGYEGIFTDFCAWESYAWMHFMYGQQKIGDGRSFDQVIPNFFDASQFKVAKKPTKDYLLYIGRIIPRKGPTVALEIAKRVGLPLIVAGPGVTAHKDGEMLATEHLTLEGDVHYAGTVGFEKRNELMANAAAVIVPTLYIEPFGGVAVEAMFAGAPVIASDWGSFTEIVTPDVGIRFRTLQQGAAAVARAKDFQRKEIRRAALKRFSLEAIGPRFTAWFDQLDTLWGQGWYA